MPASLRRAKKRRYSCEQCGGRLGEPFDDYSEKGWDKVVDLNLKAPFFLSQAPDDNCEKQRRPAKISLCSSIDGVIVNPMETYSYAASKAGFVDI